MADLLEEINSYFTFDQRLVILNVLKIAKKNKKKSIDGSKVYFNYLKMCEEINIEPIFKNGFMYALKAIELAGFIKIKEGMKITKLDLGPYTVDDWIEAIYQDDFVICDSCGDPYDIDSIENIDGKNICWCCKAGRS